MQEYATKPNKSDVAQKHKQQEQSELQEQAREEAKIQAKKVVRLLAGAQPHSEESPVFCLNNTQNADYELDIGNMSTLYVRETVRNASFVVIFDDHRVFSGVLKSGRFAAVMDDVVDLNCVSFAGGEFQ